MKNKTQTKKENTLSNVKHKLEVKNKHKLELNNKTDNQK